MITNKGTDKSQQFEFTIFPKITTMTPRRAELRDVIAAGIAFYDDPGHGWYVISSERLAYMQKHTPELLAPSNYYQDGQLYFEEDIEVSRIMLAFPEHFPDANLEHCQAMLDKYAISSS